MDWGKLLSTTRRMESGTGKKPTTIRSPFESDVDRIIYSSAFRRLNRKTQVHPFAPNDHVHTRLTHSLEVGQVGYTLGKALGQKIKKELPRGITEYDLGTIVKAACLAHDIGNPPFGHAGESAISHWFEQHGSEITKHFRADLKKDLSTFEGNAQGFRIITQTENNLFKGGLRLTNATLATFLKYPWNSRKAGQKFGAFLTEEEILNEVAEEAGLIKKTKNEWCRHPLAYLVEAADDICYAIIDLEDAVELGILNFDEVYTLLVSIFDDTKKSQIEKELVSKEMFRVNLARTRSYVFEEIVLASIDGFLIGYPDIMAGKCREKEIINLLDDDHPTKHLIKKSKKLAQEKIYIDLKKVEMEIGCYTTFDHLMGAFCNAGNECYDEINSNGETSISWKSNLVLRLLGDHQPTKGNAPYPGKPWTKYEILRRVLDFISGMTDNYATYVSKQLQGVGFSGVQRP